MTRILKTRIRPQDGVAPTGRYRTRALRPCSSAIWRNSARVSGDLPSPREPRRRVGVGYIALDLVALLDGRIDDLLERHAGGRALHLVVLCEEGFARQPLPVAGEF